MDNCYSEDAEPSGYPEDRNTNSYMGADNVYDPMGRQWRNSGRLKSVTNSA